MTFTIYETDKTGIQKFYGEIIGKNLTYAPVEGVGRDAGKYGYKKVTDVAQCNCESPIAATKSVKPLFFPQTTAFMKYSESNEGTELTNIEAGELNSKRVILGVKHCDARAMQVFDKVANWDFYDTDFITRRENSVIISTRCDKAETHCFCTSVDYDVKNSDAYDVLVVKALNGKYYVKASSEKGNNFMKDYASALSAGGSDATEKIDEQYKDFEASFRLKMDYKEVNEKLKGAFDSPAFDVTPNRCVGCNTCSFVCPTCHCFKISDEKVKDKGIRYKCYDSCNSGYFTLMAGGHNPRPAKYRRWRQRALHKFSYYKERFGENLCVGCGKCAFACPVNISIFDVVNDAASNPIKN